MLHYTCTQPGRREDRKVAATTEPSQVICSMHLNYAFLEKKTSLVGWFDSVVFENWFFKTAVPYFNGLHTDERRIIIGDNVASHLSYRVIQYYITNNIRFAFFATERNPFVSATRRSLFSSTEKSLVEYTKRLEEAQ